MEESMGVAGGRRSEVLPVLAIFASSFLLTPTIWAAAERSQGGEGAGQGGACQPHLAQLCPRLLPSSSHSLSQPKPQHCIEDSRAIKPSQSLRLGPCDGPPIGAQSALLAESRAKSSNNPSAPVVDQGKCLENCTTMTILQSQKPPSQATVLVATSKISFGGYVLRPPSHLQHFSMRGPIQLGWIKGTTAIANHSL
jgi:hypothetical protein